MRHSLTGITSSNGTITGTPGSNEIATVREAGTGTSNGRLRRTWSLISHPVYAAVYHFSTTTTTTSAHPPPHHVPAVQAVPFSSAAHPVREHAVQTAVSSSSLSVYAIPAAHDAPQTEPTDPSPAFTAELGNLVDKTPSTALRTRRADPSLQVL